MLHLSISLESSTGVLSEKSVDSRTLHGGHRRPSDGSVDQTTVLQVGQGKDRWGQLAVWPRQGDYTGQVPLQRSLANCHHLPSRPQARLGGSHWTMGTEAVVNDVMESLALSAQDFGKAWL